MNIDIAIDIPEKKIELKELSMPQRLNKRTGKQGSKNLHEEVKEIKKNTKNNPQMLLNSQNRQRKFLLRNKDKIPEFVSLMKTAVLDIALDYNRGNFGEAEKQYAEKQYLEALELCKSQPPTRLTISILTWLGTMNLKLRIYKTSEPFFEEALRLASQVENFKPSKLIMLYAYLAEVCEHLGEISKTIAYLKTALEIAKAKGIKKFNIASYYFTLAYHCKAYGFKSDAVEYFIESNRILIEIGKKDHLLAADCRIQIADYYLATEALEQSLSYYQQALEIYLQQPETQSIKARIADTYNDMGIVCLDLNDLKQAEELQVESLKIRTALFKEGHLSIAHSYNNLAAVLVKAGRNEEALINQQESLVVINRLGINKANAEVAGKYMVHLAEIHESLLDKTQALDSYHKAIGIFRQFSRGEEEEGYVHQCREKIKLLQPKLSLVDYLNPFRLCNRNKKETPEEKGLLPLTDRSKSIFI